VVRKQEANSSRIEIYLPCLNEDPSSFGLRACTNAEHTDHTLALADVRVLYELFIIITLTHCVRMRILFAPYEFYTFTIVSIDRVMSVQEDVRLDASGYSYSRRSSPGLDRGRLGPDGVSIVSRLPSSLLVATPRARRLGRRKSTYISPQVDRTADRRVRCLYLPVC